MFKSVFKSGIRGTYNVSENPSFHTDLWAVYPAKHKQSGKLASVFIFDKTKFESLVNRLCSQSSARNPRQIITECYELVKYEVSQLTKLKHPQILTILEVLEETKLKFIFASEPIVSNLQNLDFKNENDLSIQKGLLEVSKGLQFLHNYCSIIHLNLQPSSVFVNSQGDWKLGGFKFLQNLNELSPLERENFYIMNNSSVVPFANLNLNYTAPELLFESGSQKLNTSNDIWSLGMLIYYLYNKGESLINCFDSNSPSDFKDEFRKFEQKFYRHLPSELKYLLRDVPDSLGTILTQLLARYPNDRMSIDQFIDSEFFDGSLIKMMWFIDEFATKSMKEKLIFLEGLLSNSNILAELPNTFRNSKLLNLLIEVITNETALLSNKALDPDTNTLISKCLLIVFRIGELLSKLSFQDRIYDTLLTTSKTKKSESQFSKLAKVSVKVRIALVSNFELLFKKLPQNNALDIVKEMADNCLTFVPTEVDLQAGQMQLQDMFLAQLQLCASMFDFSYIKNSLFPLLCQVFKTTTVLSTKVQTIKTFEYFIDQKVIDRIIVNEQLLPVLENVKSRDKRIIGAMLEVLSCLALSEHISLELETIVDKVIAQCQRLAFSCTECNKTEFTEFLKSVQSIQTTAIKRKLDTLSAGSNDVPATNFDTVINTPLLRTGLKEDKMKAPVLQPTSTRAAEPKAKPLTLRQSGTTRPAKSFSPAVPANTQSSRLGSNTGSSDFGGADGWDDDFNDFQESHSGPAKLNVSSRTEIDWSASSQPSTPGWTGGLVLEPQQRGGFGATSAQPTSNYTSIQPTSNYSSGHTSTFTTAQPSNYNVGVTSQTQIFAGPRNANLPPGFTANLVLTPNATGSSPRPSTNLNSAQDLNFL